MFLHAPCSILGHIRISGDGAEALEQEELARDRPRQVGEIDCTIKSLNRTNI